MKLINFILIILTVTSIAIADTDKKSVQTQKTLTPPVIDGIVEDAVWDLVQPATDFFRFQPESGGHAPVKTEVKFLYDDVALYVAAIMYTDDSQNIPRQLGKRDDADVVADWFGLWISPFNDGANEVNFRLTSAGVQIDRKLSPNGSDGSWNPVWTSDLSFQ